MDSASGSGQKQIEVIKPLGDAWNHMKAMLFPFRFETWIILGILALLAGWGGGGGPRTISLPFQFFPQSHHHNATPEAFRQNTLQGMWNYLMSQMGPIGPEIPLIIVLVCIGAALFLTLYLVFAYLGSRGVFMYIDCIARRKAEFAVPWANSRMTGNSFFRWRLLLDAVAFVSMMAIAAGTVAAIWTTPFSLQLFLKLIPAWILMAAVIFVFGLARWSLNAFVAPLMYFHSVPGRAAWVIFFRLVGGHPAAFILFFLMNVVLGFVLGAAAVLALCCTCCVCCIGALPIVSQTLLQPILLWIRAFPLHFLAQFGPPCDAFLPPSPAPPAHPVPPPVMPQPATPPA